MPDNKYKNNVASKLKPIDYYVGKYVEIVSLIKFDNYYRDMNGVEGLVLKNGDTAEYPHIYAIMTNNSSDSTVYVPDADLEEGEYPDTTYDRIIEISSDGEYGSDIYFKEIDQDNIDYGL